jgi:Planctomycete cytochrome C
MSLRSIILGTFLLGLVAAPAGAQPGPSIAGEFFETRIRPVLSSKCYACHSSTLAAPKGELVLDTKAGVLKGGKLGPAIVPGKPKESRLLEALSYSNTHLQMPPSGKLADAIIADFEQWIAAGAPDPRADTAVAGARTGKRVVGENELAMGRQWWAFHPEREPGRRAPSSIALFWRSWPRSG